MSSQVRMAAFRFGYGLPLPDAAPVDPAAMAKALAGPDLAAVRWPGEGLKDLLPLHQAANSARAGAVRSDEGRDFYRTLLDRIDAAYLHGLRVTMARAVGAPDGFRERLVWFWRDHFSTMARTRPDRVLGVAMVEDAIRPHVAGRFADLLTAATLHPAMLVYLDQFRSVGPSSAFGQRRKRGLNENLARELLELHSLGVGGSYAQQDVRQLAELLTGLSFHPSLGTVFRNNWAEPGAETVLGVDYDGPGMAPIYSALHDIAHHPDTARHICQKLAVHFVSQTPDPALVRDLQAVWTQTGGDLAAVAAALVAHSLAMTPAMDKARQPFDFIAAALRALGVDGDDLMAMPDDDLRRFILSPLLAMGQPWGGAPGPDGWPEELGAWITPRGMAARIRWAMDVPLKLRRDLPDPREFALSCLGDLAEGRIGWAAARAESRREGVALVLVSPQFNRR